MRVDWTVLGVSVVAGAISNASKYGLQKGVQQNFRNCSPGPRGQGHTF